MADNRKPNVSAFLALVLITALFCFLGCNSVTPSQEKGTEEPVLTEAPGESPSEAPSQAPEDLVSGVGLDEDLVFVIKNQNGKDTELKLYSHIMYCGVSGSETGLQVDGNIAYYDEEGSLLPEFQFGLPALKAGSVIEIKLPQGNNAAVERIYVSFVGEDSSVVEEFPDIPSALAFAEENAQLAPVVDIAVTYSGKINEKLGGEERGCQGYAFMLVP